MFGDLADGVAGLRGWGFFLVVATLGALLRNRWPDLRPLRHWGLSAMGVALFILMGFGGRPLGLASFGLLALLTCIWHFRRTPWSAGMASETFLASYGPISGGRAAPAARAGDAPRGVFQVLPLLGFIKWKNPTLGVRVAAAILSCPLLLFLWLRDRKTRGASTLTSRGLSLLVGAAALGAAPSQVWPTDRLINSVLLLFVLSLPCLAWIGRRRPVWNLVLISLISAWIVMSDPKGAIAISVISAYLVLVAPEIHCPTGTRAGWPRSVSGSWRSAWPWSCFWKGASTSIQSRSRRR